MHKKNIYIVILGLLFLLSRFYLVEKDIPPIDVSGYAQIDETYYATLALDKIDYGGFFYAGNANSKQHATFLGTSYLLNVFCYLSLEVFGDTYWGLRFPSIVFGLAALALLTFSFKRISEENEFHKHDSAIFNGFLLVLIFCTDFSFLFSNIVVEPTLLRLLVSFAMMMLAHRLLRKQRLSSSLFFALGLIAIFSWLFVYLINAFIPASIACLIICNNIFNKQAVLKNALPYFLGVVAGFILVAGFSYYSGVDLLQEMNYVYQNFGGRTAINEKAGQAGFLKTIVINGLNFFKANFLNYNPLLLFFLISSLLMYSLLLLKHKTERRVSLAFASFVFLLVFFFQSLVVNDFFARKMIITYPFYLVIAFYVLCSFEKIKAFSKKVLAGVFLISGGLTLLMQGTLHWIFRCVGSADFYRIWPPVNIALVILSLTVIAYFISKKSNATFCTLLFLLIINNLYYSYQFAYKSVSENFKRSMQEISAFVNDRNMIGGWSLGFRLYNRSKPKMNPYMYYNDGINYEKDFKRISATNAPSYIVTYKSDSLIEKMHLKPERFLVNDYCTDDLYLYRIP